MYDLDDDLIDSRDVFSALDAVSDSDGMPLEGCEDEHAEHRAFWDAIVSAFGESAAEEGLILVADSYFVEYAEQLADDLGLIPEAHSWPASYIDWEAAARDLQMDYTCFEFQGCIFWVRE